MRQTGVGVRIASLVSAGFILALVSVACTKEKREADGNSLLNPSGPATLSTLQTDVFKFGCGVSGCHDDRATPAASLNMSNYDASYSGLVNTNSTQVPGMKLIQPGDAAASYLVYKLRGNHTTVGGTGDRMPQFAAPLTDADLTRVIDWINAGALRN